MRSGLDATTPQAHFRALLVRAPSKSPAMRSLVRASASQATCWLPLHYRSSHNTVYCGSTLPADRLDTAGSRDEEHIF